MPQVEYISSDNIEEIADNLNAQAGYEIPVDIEHIADSNDISLTVDYEEMEDDVSGMTVIHENGTARICINKNHHPNRQRFSLAHELGHICLHGQNQTVFIDGPMLYFRDKDSADGTEPMEIQANMFAAAILMPKQKLIEELKKHNISFSGDNDLALRRLASKFGVSVQAITLRLTKLNLLFDF